MAIILPGPLIAGIRGKVGGTVFSANGTGPYARTWAKSANPRTLPQQSRRLSLNEVAQEWQNASSAQRTAWDAWAADPAETRQNPLGEDYNPSGFNQWCRCNTNRALAGDGIRFPAPTVHDPPAIDVSLLVVQQSTSGSSTFDFPNNHFLSNRGLLYLAFARGAPVNANIGDYKLVSVLVAVGGTQFNFTSDMLAIFGEPLPGHKAFARIFKFFPQGNQVGPLQLTTTVS